MRSAPSLQGTTSSGSAPGTGQGAVCHPVFACSEEAGDLRNKRIGSQSPGKSPRALILSLD